MLQKEPPHPPSSVAATAVVRARLGLRHCIVRSPVDRPRDLDATGPPPPSSSLSRGGCGARTVLNDLVAWGFAGGQSAASIAAITSFVVARGGRVTFRLSRGIVICGVGRFQGRDAATKPPLRRSSVALNDFDCVIIVDITVKLSLPSPLTPMKEAPLDELDRVIVAIVIVVRPLSLASRS